MSYPSASDDDTARQVMPSVWEEPETLAQDIMDLEETLDRVAHICEGLIELITRENANNEH